MSLLGTDKDLFDIVSFALAVIGACGSAVLAFRRGQWKLSLKARVDPPFERIDLEIFNPGHRSVTLKKGELKYGTGAGYSEHLVEVVDLEKRVLGRDDAHAGTISIAELRKTVAGRGIKQKSYSRLWFVVTAFNGKTYSTMVVIDPAIIKAPYIPHAEIYIAADLVLGFPQKVSGVQQHWKIK